ncbi:MAG: hypothetical protein JXB15_07210 [Anaerolineales bacterium]|nr:hypothetical protein [Anaerolineales bacterium]
MGNILISLGITVWFIFAIITFVFLTPVTDSFINRLIRSVKFLLSKKYGLEFGVIVGQATGIFWLIAGLIINLMGESIFHGVREDVILSIIFLAPVTIGAFLNERRKNEG